jgi:uncharacterized lipoprotein YddW (UPF0748 family)
MYTRIPLFVTALILIMGAMPAFAQERPEFRAMWISAYGSGLLTPKEIDDSIGAAKLANLNALIVQVRKTGDAHYKSDYEPRAENIPDPNFDPLDYIIKKAHANGLEVHAWINTYKVWAGTTPPKSPDHVFNKHPEWVTRNIYGQLDKSGQYGLDPGIPEVQQHLFNVYMDVVKKYDVDGIHFDYVRYWSPDFGYSKIAVDRFNKETGRTGIPAMDDREWCDWRRDRVTDLVRQIYEGATKLKPWMKVTGSVVCSQPCTAEFKDSHPYNLLLQDWERWCREGIIDAVVPMNYKSESDPVLAAQFRDWIDGMVKWKHGRHAYNGISVRGIDEYVTQVTETRTRGADGEVGFDFGPRGSRDMFALGLRQNLYPRSAPTPEMPWKATSPIRIARGSSDGKALSGKAVYYFLVGLSSSPSADINHTMMSLRRLGRRGSRGGGFGGGGGGFGGGGFGGGRP